MWLSLLAHECGHMLGGLPAGCSFVMINIGRTALLKDAKGHLRFARCRDEEDETALMSGHCMLRPPGSRQLSVVECGRILLAGGAVNIVLAAVSLTLLAAAVQDLKPLGAGTPDHGMDWLGNPLALYILITTAVINLTLAWTALIPGKDNDCRQFLEIRSDPALARVYTNLLRIETMSADGVSVTEMPQKLFRIPAGAQGTLVREMQRITEEYTLKNEPCKNTD